MNRKEALKKIKHSRPKIIGIQVMFSMKEAALEIAQLVKEDCEFLVAGGPLPTSNPTDFFPSFDAVVIGEGEQTMLELVHTVQEGTSLMNVRGIAFKEEGRMSVTPPRSFIRDLDSVPFPSRETFGNQAYKDYYSRKFGYTTTSIITSRGCPFKCDFCSRPVFGNRFRSRTASNIAEEVEAIRRLGYDRVWFADDCFTLDRKRLLSICNELLRRHTNIGWECLSRVDTVDSEVAEKMKQAGCIRVFFGIESGNDSVLRIMKKQANTKQAKDAVHTFKKAGIQVGAFFILGYPGENDKTVLDTVNFASSLPLDYLSFTLPYPIPGTPLFDKVKNKMTLDDWKEPRKFHLIKHKLLFRSRFSENKLKFAIFKGMTQFYLLKYSGKRLYNSVGKIYEHITDAMYRILN